MEPVRNHKRRRTALREEDPPLHTHPISLMYKSMTPCEPRPAQLAESVHRELNQAQRYEIPRSTQEPALITCKPGGSSPAVPNKKPRKRAHYLQHAVRCSIIRRVAEGEPQAALAREFGVTRAAVCQMYKNREEILAREDSEDEAEPRALALEGRSKTVQLLVTTLKDARTSAAAFRRAASRLSFILVEESLASFDAQEIELIALSGHAYGGLEQNIRVCGITLGEENAQFVTALSQIDPSTSTGQIDVKEECASGHKFWRLVFLDVPADITNFEIILFSSCGNGGAECEAIEVLRSIGVLECNITLVMIVYSSDGFEEITNRFPHLSIISASIDDGWSLERGAGHQLSFLCGDGR